MLALLEDIRPDVEFAEETHLIDDGILDSLDIISIVQAVSETFGVNIDVDDLEPESFNSVTAMVELVQKLQA